MQFSASAYWCELVHHDPVGAFLASARNPLGTAIPTDSRYGAAAVRRAGYR